MVKAVEVLNQMGLGYGEVAKQIRAVIAATTDWKAIADSVAKTQGPVWDKILQPGREAYRTTITTQMNTEQGAQLQAQKDAADYWAHAGEAAEQSQAAFYAARDAATAAAGAIDGNTEAQKNNAAAAQQATSANQALAGSFSVVTRSASEWRAQAATMAADAERMAQAGGTDTSGFLWQTIQNLRSGSQSALASAGRQDALDRAISSGTINAGSWGNGSYRSSGWTVNVNGVVNGDQIANELVSGMRSRGISPGVQ
jgi:hypothetical protein